VLVVVGSEESLPEAMGAIRNALAGILEPELLVCRFLPAGAKQLLESRSI
jgi:hypothetical protein